jgi:peptidoglycan/xylan/chitin deacetylase (PgdA/CDA1 family)
MNWHVWHAVEEILRETGVKPLLAVVPDNRDPNLNVCQLDRTFWDKVRAWQQIGWSIGLHGFQHQYSSTRAGILGRNRYSEFAGLVASEQRRKLQAASAIFREQQVRPDAWVAPAHSFDHTTLDLLAELGINCISDGYALLPFLCERGLFWIPQQLGRFYDMPFGVWTVCVHINSWKERELAQFRSAIARFRPRITSLAELYQRYCDRRRTWSDDIFFACFRAARSLRA